MGLLKNILIKTHRVTGTFLSLMFVVWFISGIVLIFKGFPHAPREERFLQLQTFAQSDFEKINFLKDSVSGSVELEKFLGKPVYRIPVGKRNQKVYDAQTLQIIDSFSEDECLKVAEDYSGLKVAEVETLTHLDQWMPWSYYEPMLPIYKCKIDNTDKTNIYVSSKNGNIVQQTDKNSRFAAYFGAIPHWIYFRSLRIKAELWSSVVIWISGIGAFACFTGIIAGFFRLNKRREEEKFKITPYKKFWYKWHHLVGFAFGLFVFTFVLSGMFSLADLPKWVSSKGTDFVPQKEWNKSEVNISIPFSSSQVWNVINKTPNIRKVTWQERMDVLTCFVYSDSFNSPQVFIITNDTIKKQEGFSLEDINKRASELFPDTRFSVTMQREYDNYYQKSGMTLHPLPVYRIDWKNSGENQLFIDPHTGEAIVSYNKTSKIHRWLYQGLHKFNFQFLNEHEWLRRSILIFLSIGGLALSVTSFVLGLKWIKRNYKSTLKKIKK